VFAARLRDFPPAAARAAYAAGLDRVYLIAGVAALAGAALVAGHTAWAARRPAGAAEPAPRPVRA
jgi:hypothetical protein